MRKSRLAAVMLGLGALITLTQCFTDKQNEGERVYAANCASCHMDDGSGLRGVIPPLANSDYLASHRKQLPCLVRQGLNGEITVNGIHYNRPMPASEKLRPDEITNLLNYIQTNFGNQNERYTMQEVKKYLQYCPQY
ncbi:cytochrome c [Pontibacter sp. 172403-2]|uniref:c-type cytochrome n=1 Tax=Pontibacter rufus TaxID=2791028 RepID=UPI0018B00EB5|nr:cytochrome c [Pontibacter sp. 172403-2]MBF9255041.1 cytochrome c [Pontibacter sp. 172403-2]